MSLTATLPTQKQRSFLRFRLPWLILGLGALGVVLLWAWPSSELERFIRVVDAWSLGTLTGLALAIWFLVLGPNRWPVRVAILLGVLLGMAAVGTAAVRRIEFSGDMGLIIHWRWQADPQDVLEAHRRGQPTGALPPVDLSTVLPTDFPGYLGPNRNAVVQGPTLPRDWSARPPQQRWQQPIGGGYAGFAVVHGALFTAEQRRDHEAIVCYDAVTGRERWVYEYPASFYEPQGGAGPRATPTVADGDVYAFGATGQLVCVEGETGKLKWQVDTLADNDNLQWGLSGSPLVFDNLVVVNPGAQRESAKGRAVIAYDRQTGREVWKAGSGKASPAGAGEMWRFPWKTYQDINVAQPIVLPGDRIFLSAGYGHGCALIQVSQVEGAWTPKQLWKNRNLRCRFTTPVHYQDHFYGLDEGILVCVDARDGRRVWKDGRYGNGQLLLTGDLLLILAESGELALVEASPAEYRELGRVRVLEGEKTWNTPALVDGTAYVRNHHQMACFDLLP
jgi:outer membrane protein assembly factor BamB